MADLLFYVFLLVGIAALLLVGVFLLKSYLDGSSPTSALFGPRPERRIAVIEQASVDGRRKLLLIRRDEVEHLIMTGGPVDVVIETGIGTQRVRAADVPPPLYNRQPRATFGQAGQAGQSAGSQTTSERAAG